jgi:hypothetical protein
VTESDKPTGDTGCDFLLALARLGMGRTQKHLRTTLGFQSIDDFVVCLIRECAAFEAIQGIANGSKHFRSEQAESITCSLEEPQPRWHGGEPYSPRPSA